jgi:hypothetical protein
MTDRNKNFKKKEQKTKRQGKAHGFPLPPPRINLEWIIRKINRNRFIQKRIRREGGKTYKKSARPMLKF